LGKNVPDFNATAPVINNTYNIQGSVVAQRDLEAMTENAALRGYQKAKTVDAKWSPVKTK
jgi:hypothetical protein